MANTNRKHEINGEEQVAEVLSKSEQFLKENGKKLVGAIAAVVIIIACYFGYQSFVKTPAEQKAYNASFVAQQLFAEKDMAQALNGDGVNMGFAEIAKEFGSTSVGNIANHYAGVCNLHLGNYQEAVDYLTSYKAADGAAAEVINAQNLGLTGDAYSQLQQYDKALDFYNRAANNYKSAYSTPLYLKKAGLVMLEQKNTSGAKEAFEKIQNEYPASLEARDIAKLIAQCQ